MKTNDIVSFELCVQLKEHNWAQLLEVGEDAMFYYYDAQKNMPFVTIIRRNSLRLYTIFDTTTFITSGFFGTGEQLIKEKNYVRIPTINELLAFLPPKLVKNRNWTEYADLIIKKVGQQEDTIEIGYAKFDGEYLYRVVDNTANALARVAIWLIKHHKTMLL